MELGRPTPQMNLKVCAWARSSNNKTKSIDDSNYKKNQLKTVTIN